MHLHKWLYPKRPDSSESAHRPSLVTIILVFLYLGSTAFGGPAAHIALMESELVQRRSWLSRDEFLDLLGAANLIPGPNSTELAMHIGYRLAGLPGLFLAGACFILPAFLMVTAIAALYSNYGKLPALSALLYGLKPVILAIVFQALWALSKTSLKTSGLKVIAEVVFVLYLLGVNQILLLFGSGLIASFIHYERSKAPKETLALSVVSSVSGFIIILTCLLTSYTPRNLPYSLEALFGYFFKLGTVLYGSGYVLLAFLRSDLVEHYRWISSAQLLDAVAVGQMTPGPVFTAATFIGFILGGTPGALIATVGIFLPAFALVAVTAPVIKNMRASALAAKFLDAVNAAAIALMAVVLCQLAQAAFVDAPTVLLGLTSGYLLVRYKLNSLWVMIGGALAGLILHGR